jgi:hypothetical protein
MSELPTRSEHPPSARRQEGGRRTALTLESPHWEMRPFESRPRAAAIVCHLHQRNFVLCLQGPDIYGFVHRTFLGYLIGDDHVRRLRAEEMTLEDLTALFCDRAQDHRWHEILRVICGLVDPKEAAILIKQTFYSKDVVTWTDREHLVLCAELLSEVSKPNEASDTCHNLAARIIQIAERGSRLLKFRITVDPRLYHNYLSAQPIANETNLCFEEVQNASNNHKAFRRICVKTSIFLT